MSEIEQKLRSYLEKTTAALRQTKQDLQQLELLQAKQREPVAIVGMACRFPGGVRSPEELWNLLAEGRDAVTGFPTDRGWQLDGLHDPDRDKPGTTYTTGGGFIDEPYFFDAGFFGISPREAAAMDPQQRLLLELSWEALEHARIVPASLYESSTGVFVGTLYDDYLGLVPPPELATDGYGTLGNLSSVASGRISYSLGLQGPAFTVDTACSSAGVAIHLACQSLRHGECELALAGAATVFSTPDPLLWFSRLKTLSVDGRCRAFAAEGDGAGWAEGAAMLVLERLSDAQRNGHRILALVRGSAINQDGRSQGLTAPNGPAQRRVIRAALAAAGLSAKDVDIIEAHGTGTKLGDPIEANALIATYGREHTASEPVWLGSIKSNFGHTQAVAGAAGLMKLVLAMQHGLMPRSLFCENPTPEVDWSEGTVRLLATPRPWTASDRPRRGAVSAFGISGTNAHLLVEEAPPPTTPDAPPESRERPPHIPLVVSARTEASLREQAARLRSHIAARPALELVDVAHSLIATRTQFDCRAVVVADDRQQALDTLDALARLSPDARYVSANAEVEGKVVFVFPGQGSQWPAMASALLRESSVFREHMQACADALAPHVDWSLLDVLDGEPSLLERVDVVQPVLWAMMISLAGVWRSLGITPDVVVGHSQGEIAAAHIAGILSLADSAKIVALRSRVIRSLAGTGAMAAVHLSADELHDHLQPYGSRLSIGVDNGPASTVVSGEPQAIDALVASLDGQGIFARKVKVDYASHCAQIEPIRDQLLRMLADVRPQPASVPMISTVDLRAVEGPELDAGYWYRNLRQTVRFADAVREVLGSGHRLFVEVSPHPVLPVAIDALIAESGAPGAVVPTLRRNEGELARVHLSLAKLHCHGHPVDWLAWLAPHHPTVVDLPTYAFARERHWLERRKTQPTTPSSEPQDAALWTAVEAGDEALAELFGLELDESSRALFAALRDRYQREHRSRTVDGWRYRVVWRAGRTVARPVTGQSWLVVASAAREPLAKLLCGVLESQTGAPPLSLTVDASHDRAQLGASLKATLGEAHVSGVISLLALDERDHAASSAATVGVRATLAVMQALAAAQIEAPVWFVTHSAAAVHPGEPVGHPEQAMVAGLARVFALEHPRRWGGLIDVDAEDQQTLAALVVAINRSDAEDQLALRAGKLFVRRLVRAPLPRGARPEFRARGTALITGGTGAVGAQVARWLASSGVEHLVLTSRRGADSARARELQAELAALGTRVTIVACDSSDPAALAALVTDLRHDQAPLRSIFHAAGVLGDLRGLADLTLDEYRRVATGKAVGALSLHALTEQLELDAFVTFSSASAVLGGGQQGAYAAANSLLDALAEHRAGRGLPATSIAWGAWGEHGMATGELREHFESHGLQPMDPKLAIEALAHSLARDDTTLMVVDMDWDRFTPSYMSSRHRPLLDEIDEAKQALDGAAGSETSLLDQLAGLPRADQQRLLLQHVLDATASVLGFASGSSLDPRTGFADLGLDSLMAVQLRQHIQELTGLRLPSTLAFDYPTPQRVADVLADELLGDPAAAAAAEPSVDHEFDGLSDDELLGEADSLLGEI
ncbi:MAG TPA: type I polyketide synthase [Enhygromyxa sp.]|nr:type I polyketide synthase [Enhygromyxa sp.]